MKKKELIESIAAATGINNSTAETSLVSILDAITTTLENGDAVTLVGFGFFSISKRIARKGKNPQNGETIDIPAKNAVRFRMGKSLLGMIN